MDLDKISRLHIDYIQLISKNDFLLASYQILYCIHLLQIVVLTLLSLFSDAIKEVIVISNVDELYSEGQREHLEENGLKLRQVRQLSTELPNMDVVYINAIAWVGDSYVELGKEYHLNTQSQLKKDAIILHPLARGDELATSLDDTTHNWYFAQARGAVYMRMALLSTIMRF